jgi:GntR family transcriptional regulator
MPPRGEPEFRRIARQLIEAIESGEIASGTALPSLAQLAAAEGVSLSTMQRALLIVEARGLIEGRQGKATYVVDRSGPEGTR